MPPGRFALDGLQLRIEGDAASGAASLRRPTSLADLARNSQVDLFDWRRGAWRPVELVGPVVALRDAAAFVSATGDIRVRSTFRPDRQGGRSSVTVSRLEIEATGLAL